MSQSLTTLDVVLAFILLLSGLIAFLRGFVHEVLGLLAWAGASLAALHGLVVVRPMAHEMITVPWLADAAAVVGIFIVVLLLLSMVTKAISRAVQATMFGSLDRSLGFLFGLLRGGLLVSLAYLLVDTLVPVEDRPIWLNEARSVPLMDQGAEMVRAVVPDDFLERTRTATDAAAERTRQAMEADAAFRRLQAPVPMAPPRQP